MQHEQFLQQLSELGFTEPVLVQYPENGYLDQHSHPFEVWALVVEGSLKIQIDGIDHAYYVGDVFHLDFAQPHSEYYGSNGVKYLASRK